MPSFQTVMAALVNRGPEEWVRAILLGALHKFKSKAFQNYPFEHAYSVLADYYRDALREAQVCSQVLVRGGTPDVYSAVAERPGQQYWAFIDPLFTHVVGVPQHFGYAGSISILRFDPPGALTWSDVVAAGMIFYPRAQILSGRIPKTDLFPVIEMVTGTRRGLFKSRESISNAQLCAAQFLLLQNKGLITLGEDPDFLSQKIDFNGSSQFKLALDFTRSPRDVIGSQI